MILSIRTMEALERLETALGWTPELYRDDTFWNRKERALGASQNIESGTSFCPRDQKERIASARDQFMKTLATRY